jgi:hypothetical protein
MFDPLGGHRRFITIGIIFAACAVLILVSPAMREKTSSTDILLGSATLGGVGALLIVIGVVIGRRRR